MFGRFVLPVLLCFALLASCRQFQNSGSNSRNADKPDIKTANSIVIPSDKESSPVPGVTSFSNPDTTLVFTSVGQTYNVGFGKEVNLVYEGGINPDDTYLVYESTLDGYTLQLKNRTDEVEVKLERLCQYYIVASPNFTTIKVNPSLKYEQIIWTPRPDGTWEVRIGATERGCKSKALQELQKVRTKDYEKGLPKK